MSSDDRIAPSFDTLSPQCGSFRRAAPFSPGFSTSDSSRRTSANTTSRSVTPARCGIRDIPCLPPECRLERCRDGAELRPASRRREILLHRSPSHPVDGCRAEGMTHVEDEQIPSAVTISSPQGRRQPHRATRRERRARHQKQQRFPRYHHSPLPRRRPHRHEST